MRTAAKTVPRRAFMWPSARAVILGAAAILFVGICVLPTVYMFGVSFAGVDGSFSFYHYRQLLLDPRERDLLLNTALLGTGTAALATIIGAPLGLLLARADLPVKRFLRLALVVPLVIPPYILGLAWIYIGGSAGVLARVLGHDLLSHWTYSLTGAVITLSIGFYPLAMLATEAAARRVDAQLEEAGLMVTRPLRVLRRITLPLVAPSIASSALVIFVLALSEFGVPGLLRVPVFTTEVFTAFAALYDFGAATALAVPLLVVALIAGVAVKLLVGKRMITTRRSTHSGLALPLGGWRALTIGSVVVVLFLSVGLPLTVLAIEAGRVERIVFAIRTSSEAIANSIFLATIGATLIVALAVLLGYGQARARTRLRGLVDLVFIVVFAVPSTVVGIGLINLWNRPGLPGEVYKSTAIIVIAYLARFVPVGALILAASVRQMPVSSEESAEVAGAGWLRSFARIVLPQIPNGLAAAWVVAFILAFGELGATVLVTPPGESTLPVRIYTMIANTPSSEVAALALMQVGVIIIPLALLGVLARGTRLKW
ncbi:MAG: iron ABC transporter permease [Pyrinomonadaceae bacterium]|nr:iron ABC transporter permease [Pyrinomonadaceae bacterium]